MAEEDDEQVQDEGEVAKKKAGSGKKKLIILIVVGLLVMAGAVGGTLFMLGFFDTGDDEGDAQGDAEDVVQEEVIEKPKPAMYFPIKPAFVVNFHSRGRQRYLQTELSVMTRDMEVFNAMQTHSPLIKHRMGMLLSGEVYEELQTDEGKELLRQKALNTLQEIMQQEIGKAGIEQVLFTSFVMQ